MSPDNRKLLWDTICESVDPKQGHLQRLELQTRFHNHMDGYGYTLHSAGVHQGRQKSLMEYNKDFLASFMPIVTTGQPQAGGGRGGVERRSDLVAAANALAAQRGFETPETPAETHARALKLAEDQLPPPRKGPPNILAKLRRLPDAPEEPAIAAQVVPDLPNPTVEDIYRRLGRIEALLLRLTGVDARRDPPPFGR